MRIARVLGVLAAAAAWPAWLAGQGPAVPASCEAAGPVKFVCGQSGPEDLVAVPGTRWLIASAFGGDGGLFAIDTRAASSTKVYPVAAAAAKLDKAVYDLPGSAADGAELPDPRPVPASGQRRPPHAVCGPPRQP